LDLRKGAVSNPLPSGSGRLVVSNFHRLAKGYFRDAGLHWPQNPQPAFWRDEVASGLMDATENLSKRNLPSKFDAVIVDEGQDFLPDWWMAVELLLRDPSKSHLRVFRDTNQRIGHLSPEGVEYDLSSPAELGEPFVLDMNCRNTRRIGHYCAEIVSDVVTTIPEDSPGGLDVELRPAVAAHRDRLEKATRILNDWLSDGVPASEMVVQTPYEQPGAGEALIGAWGLLERRLHGLSCVGPNSLFQGATGKRDVLRAWAASKAVLVSTVRSFKGLEAKYVLLMDISGTTRAFGPSDFYVAASRAKIHLVILPATTEGYELARAAIRADKVAR
jgi:superfamily I DNA/RNA helicase